MGRQTKLLALAFMLFVLFTWGVWWSIFLVPIAFGLQAAVIKLKTGRWPWANFSEERKITRLGLAGANAKTATGAVIEESKPKITFNDIAGIDEAKEELMEVVDFLKNKDKYLKLGGRLPKGVMMVGPPGVGKTLSAKAIAGEAEVSMIEIAGSSFVNRFVGVGASNIRDLFNRAKKTAPCIIFIDEFDSLGRRAGGENEDGGNREYHQTINELLVQMDGFSSLTNIVVIAATNRIDKVDPAFLRGGRFDRQIFVPLPDVRGRESILKIHARNKPLAPDVDLNMIAQMTPGMSGADLENLLNEAAITAGRLNKEIINMESIVAAKEKVILGKERKSLVISEEEKRITAYHEIGHAILALVLKNCDPPDKVTIIPRNMALGLTSLTPKERHNVSKDYLRDQLIMLMGGRAAEKIIFGDETAGAKNDITKATDIACAMVCEYGMSEKLGPIAINTARGLLKLGSPSIQSEAWSEIRNLLNQAQNTAMEILKENMDNLHTLAKMLLKNETISGTQITEELSKSKISV